MASPSLAVSSYKNVQELTDISKKINEEREALFAKKPLIKKIAYYAITAFALLSLVAVPACLALAAIDFSVGYLACAAVATVGIFLFSSLRGRFNSFTNKEEFAIKKFENPLSLFENRDSVPAAGVLRGDRWYLESLIGPTKDAAAQVKQNAEFKVVQNLLKLDETDLKAKINTLMVTSLMLEAIQYVYSNESMRRMEVANKAEKFIDLTSYDDEKKRAIREFFAKIKVATKEDLAKIKAAVATKGGKPEFKMADLNMVG